MSGVSTSGVRDHLNAFLDLPNIPVKHASSGLLSGLKFGAKEIYDVKGYKTTFANPDFDSEAKVASQNAPVVQALLDAGAEFVGKTQSEEFAWCLSGLSTHLPPAINPAAPDRTTGGSSSGSVAAVAGGLVDFALGSDTVGSIRGPASFCGLIGLRPTYERLSLEGILPGSPTFDAPGWFAKDLETYEKVAKVLLSPTSNKALNIDESNVQLLVLPEHEQALIGRKEVKEYFRMLSIIENLFGTAEEVKLNESPDELLNIIAVLRAYDPWKLFGDWFKAKPRNMLPSILKRFLYASTITEESAETERHKLAKFREEFKNLLGNNKIIVLPTAPSCSLLRTSTHEEWNDFRNRAGKLLGLSPLSGFPEITIPLGSVHGAPFGISLLGPANSDESLIKLARKILEHVNKA